MPTACEGHLKDPAQAMAANDWLARLSSNFVIVWTITEVISPGEPRATALLAAAVTIPIALAGPRTNNLRTRLQTAAIPGLVTGAITAPLVAWTATLHLVLAVIIVAAAFSALASGRVLAQAPLLLYAMLTALPMCLGVHAPDTLIAAAPQTFLAQTLQYDYLRTPWFYTVIPVDSDLLAHEKWTLTVAWSVAGSLFLFLRTLLMRTRRQNIA